MAAVLGFFVTMNLASALFLLNCLVHAAADPAQKTTGTFFPNGFIPANHEESSFPPAAPQGSESVKTTPTFMARPVGRAASQKPVLAALVTAGALLAITLLVMKCFRIIQESDGAKFAWRKLSAVSNVTSNLDCTNQTEIAITLPTITLPTLQNATQASAIQQRTSRAARKRRDAQAHYNARRKAHIVLQTDTRQKLESLYRRRFYQEGLLPNLKDELNRIISSMPRGRKGRKAIIDANEANNNAIVSVERLLTHPTLETLEACLQALEKILDSITHIEELELTIKMPALEKAKPKIPLAIKAIEHEIKLEDEHEKKIAEEHKIHNNIKDKLHKAKHDAKNAKYKAIIENLENINNALYDNPLEKEKIPEPILHYLEALLEAIYLI